jgi:hypothetical protein
MVKCSCGRSKLCLSMAFLLEPDFFLQEERKEDSDDPTERGNTDHIEI